MPNECPASLAEGVGTMQTFVRKRETGFFIRRNDFLMQNRFIRLLALCSVLASAIGVAPATRAQTRAETVAVAPEASQGAVAQAVSDGQRLEAQQRWADALNHYEKALRKFPGDATLARRFEIARMHYSVESRYQDRSFVSATATLDQLAAFDLLAEMLLKIDTHYVTTPAWQQVAERGIASLEIGLYEPQFQKANRLQFDERQFAYLRGELRNLLRNQRIVSRDQVVSLAQQAGSLTQRRVGLKPSVVALEFTAAAAGGLDNYSAFLSGDELREIFSQIEGNFVGLGVELKPNDGLLEIVAVIPGSPAQRSGLQAGDKITAIDGRLCRQMTTAQADSMLTGEEGTTVRITVEGPDGQTRSADVRREHVDVPSLENVRIVDAEYGVAYVRIPVFQKTTSADLENALWDLHRQGMRSLVIDLRGNPGGLLTSSVELADKFVAQGRIVSTRGRSAGEDFDYQAHRAGTWRVPLVVLIDENSASASEIFAAAIRDNRRGTLVGQRSFGKGSVQGIFPLGYAGIGVRLTTANFYGPNSQPISKVGVEPDIPVQAATGSAEGTQIVGFRGESTAAAGDLVLDRAVDVARGQVALR
jgi:carboxyl-terminal processing protease